MIGSLDVRPSFVSKIERDLKEPILLSEKSSGSLPGYMIYRIAQVIQIRHGLGGSQLVCYTQPFLVSSRSSLSGEERYVTTLKTDV